MADSELPETFVKGFHDEDSVRKMQYNPLGNTGMNVSVIGCGGAPLGGWYGDFHEEKAVQSVRDALVNGINYIDTAPWYGMGKSETRIGRAIKHVPRQAYYIATKVGRYKPNVEEMFDFSAEKTLQSVDDSLRYLGLDYVDIIQVHDIEHAKSPDIILNETLPALEKVRQAGKARFIGITAYPLNAYRDIIERSTVKIDTILSYAHLTMHDTTLLDYLSYFKEKGIGVINASPFAMGFLTPHGPQPWLTTLTAAKPHIKENCRKAVEYCQTKGVDITKLALHYTLSHNAVPITVIGTTSPDEMKTNIGSACGSLTAVESETLQYVLEKFMRPLNNDNWAAENQGLQSYT
ncbi:uncharacterized protein [Amphiura filiformis]|uniref:uncharacterized protein n=1 Tax=Amphiura filiformis TaxID=82378 RepID=UPI003B219CC4